MTYFVKVNQINSTDYMIKNIVNAEMTHHINKLYVIISYFCVVKGKQNTKKQYTLLTVLLICLKFMQEINPGQSVVIKMRLNGGKPIALLLVPRLIPDVQ